MKDSTEKTAAVAIRFARAANDRLADTVVDLVDIGVGMTAREVKP